jgi:hypothetical protein
MPESENDTESTNQPVVIDISLLEAIRKERVVAAVILALAIGLAITIYLNVYYGNP